LNCPECNSSLHQQNGALTCSCGESRLTFENGDSGTVRHNPTQNTDGLIESQSGEELISIVIPALNEEDGIREVIQEIPDEICGHQTEVIVVDDGSTDETPAIARDAGATVVEHETNQGYGAALQTGFSHANGDILGFLDADNTYPPEEFPRLMEELQETDTDIVAGTRLQGENKGMPFIRRVGNHLFGGLVRLLTRGDVTDPASGMRLMRREAFEELTPLSDDLDFTPEMTTKAMHVDSTYEEVPITYRKRVGDSKLGAITHGYRFFSVITRTVRDYAPMRIFGSLGILIFLLGIGVSGFVVADWLLRGIGHIYFLNFGTLAVFLGVQLFMFGALADMFTTN